LKKERINHFDIPVIKFRSGRDYKQAIELCWQYT